jgi:hypothetical protein
VAERTISCKGASDVIWICGGIKISQVAIDAITVKPDILIVDMTLLTKNCPMSADQWECRIIMRKC